MTQPRSTERRYNQNAQEAKRWFTKRLGEMVYTRYFTHRDGILVPDWKVPPRKVKHVRTRIMLDSAVIELDTDKVRVETVALESVRIDHLNPKTGEVMKTAVYRTSEFLD